MGTKGSELFSEHSHCNTSTIGVMIRASNAAGGCANLNSYYSDSAQCMYWYSSKRQRDMMADAQSVSVQALTGLDSILDKATV
jgi:hypothetical protein